MKYAVVFFIACSTTADAPSNDAPQSKEAPLINGKITAAADLPGTMQVVGNCTVSKVGARLILTASHCVRTEKGGISSSFKAGRTIEVATDGAPKRFTIVQTRLHPRIVELCSANACTGTAAGAKRDAPDIALIEVKEEITDVPVVAIDEEPMLPGDHATMVGYGCTSFDSDKLRSADSLSLASDAIVHDGSPYQAGDAEIATMSDVYVFTAGPGGADPEAPGLCPGDSGGPLYRVLGGELTIVGVNASYTFTPNGSDPVTNWHARVDANARHDVLTWLQQQGATSKRSCNHTDIPCHD